jgi:hypothetical protein
LKTRACREERLAFLAAVVCLSPPPRGPLTPTSSDDYLHSQEFESAAAPRFRSKITTAKNFSKLLPMVRCFSPSSPRDATKSKRPRWEEHHTRDNIPANGQSHIFLRGQDRIMIGRQIN